MASRMDEAQLAVPTGAEIQPIPLHRRTTPPRCRRPNRPPITHKFSPGTQKIGSLGTYELCHASERMRDRGVKILRPRADEAHRDAGDYVLERGTPARCPRTRLKPQPDMGQQPHQKQ